MRALVVVASLHGSTLEIADEIASQLRSYAIAVDVQEAGDAADVAKYDVIVIGSAVYMGHLLLEIKTFAEANRMVLGTKPAWVFASGPVGDPPAPKEIPGDLEQFAADVGALGCRSFGGRLDPTLLGVKERIVVKAVRAKPGDNRPWGEIRDWTDQIASRLEAGATLAQ